MRGQSCEGAGDKVNPRHDRKGERGRGRERKRAQASEHVSERQDEISKKIYQSFGGVTEYSFKMLQEVSNSLKIMGSINIFSVLFLNLSFYTSCIFP